MSAVRRRDFLHVIEGSFHRIGRAKTISGALYMTEESLFTPADAIGKAFFDAGAHGRFAFGERENSG